MKPSMMILQRWGRLLEKLDKDMEANATNSVKLREIMEQKEKAQADLDEKMDRWVILNDLAERIEAQKVKSEFFSDAIDLQRVL